MIRVATLDDIDIIRRICDASFEINRWSNASFIQEFSKDHSIVYIYEFEGKAVGYMVIWKLSLTVELVTFAIEKEYQNKGLGKKFLTTIVKEYKGYTWFLEVNVSNDVALNLYKFFDFKECGIIKNYYGSNLNAVRMTREAIA